MNNHDLTQTLKLLDAAPESELDDVTRRRAAARREQIFSSSEPDHRDAPVAARPRKWSVAVAGIAAATVVGVVLAGALTPATPAYASWTSTPASVTAAERKLTWNACADASGRRGGQVVLAERRGEWIGVAAVTTEPAVISCLVYLPSGAPRPEHVMSGVSGGQSAIPSAGEFTDGAISEFRETAGFFGLGVSPAASFNVGDVGPNVAAVDITTADGDVVHATVENGRFIAWWPGRAFGDEIEGNGGPAPDLSYRITLTDGTVTDDAQPVLPE